MSTVPPPEPEPGRSGGAQEPYPGQHPYPDQQHPYPGHGAESPSAGKTTSFGYALLAVMVWVGVNVILTLAISGPPPSARDAGAFVGGMLIPVLLAALATWAIARRRAGGWPFWQLVLLALPFYLVIRAFLVAVSTAS